jgi:hypothetical protein
LLYSSLVIPRLWLLREQIASGTMNYSCSLTAQKKVKVEVTLQLVVYHRSVALGVKCFEIFLQLNLAVKSLCNILSDEKMGLCLMNMLGISSDVRLTHMACYWKFFLLKYIKFVCPYRLSKADHAYLTYPILQRQLSHLNGREIDNRQIQVSYILHVWLRLILYREHVHSPGIKWLLFVVCMVLFYTNKHMESWKPCAYCGLLCTLENFQWCREHCFVGAAIFKVGVCWQFPGGKTICHYWFR